MIGTWHGMLRKSGTLMAKTISYGFVKSLRDGKTTHGYTGNCQNFRSLKRKICEKTGFLRNLPGHFSFIGFTDSQQTPVSSQCCLSMGLPFSSPPSSLWYWCSSLFQVRAGVKTSGTRLLKIDGNVSGLRCRLLLSKIRQLGLNWVFFLVAAIVCRRDDAVLVPAPRLKCVCSFGMHHHVHSRRI